MGGLYGREYLTRLRQSLVERFIDVELELLCFDLDVDHEVLPREGKAARAQALIVHLERRQRIPDLVAAIRQLRPDILWDDLASGVPQAVPPPAAQPRTAQASRRPVLAGWDP